jgi:GR25 family glycosyltransferase involved in LPS biosynthesis
MNQKRCSSIETSSLYSEVIRYLVLIAISLSCVWFLFIFVGVSFSLQASLSAKEKLQYSSGNSSDDSPRKAVIDIPVYFVNLDSDSSRRAFMKRQLKEKGFLDIQRISAWTVDDVKERVTVEVSSFENMIKPNLKEIACLSSHLYAIYLAVTDTSNSSPYALIMEDDVRFEVISIKWTELTASAPKDFSILQLSTSNNEAVTSLWEEYLMLTKNRVFLRGSIGRQPPPAVHPAWKKRIWQDYFWSTQAYLVNKATVRPLIENLVKIDPVSNEIRITIGRINRPEFATPKRIQNYFFLPFRVVADIYLYTYFTPTYITRVPMFNGISENHKEIMETSYIQDANKVVQHRKSFQEIEKTIRRIKRRYSHRVPSYLKL